MEFSNAEWQVMSQVWQHESVTATQVHQALLVETDWAYSTVKTMLVRLSEKGALSMERGAKQAVFRPLVSRDAARQAATASLISRVFDGAVGGLVQHLLGGQKLSKKDREHLQALPDAEQGKRR